MNAQSSWDSGQYGSQEEGDESTLSMFSSGALPAAQLMQWINDDETAVDFAVNWSVVVLPIATLVDWRLSAVVVLPAILRLAQRRLALSSLVSNGVVSHTAIQQALVWVATHDEAPKSPRPLGRLRSRAHELWRASIAKRYATPFVAPDAYQLLAEREVEQLAVKSAKKNAA